ncbi:Ribonuclease H-like superfamily [Sesbania bispinosa]|nr:Ribonuclease H-like superfamily [Sesbania bispinosa]
MVKDIWQNGNWSLNSLATQLPVDIANFITQIPAPNFAPNESDVWMWLGSSDGIYTTRKGYSWLLNALDERGEKVSWRRIWKVQAPEKGVDGSVDDCAALWWSPPPSGFFKLNVDGCFNILDGFMGIGGVLRNSAGHWIWGFSAQFVLGSSLEAELRALKAVWASHGRKIPWDVRIVHVLREANCLADHMSRLTTYRDGRVQLWDNPPRDALVFLLADCHS